MSFYCIRWSNILTTTNKNILSPSAEERYPIMHKVQKLKEEYSIKHPNCGVFSHEKQEQACTMYPYPIMQTIFLYVCSRNHLGDHLKQLHIGLQKRD